MISFYPGPSRLYSSIPLFMKEACDKGVLSINHRSPEFVAISKRVTELFKQKLEVPEEYSLFFTSSATECWEIIAQSLVEVQASHFYNGAFGEKWFEYTQKLVPKTQGYSFGLETQLNADNVAITESSELIALTQNETSNGTQLSNASIVSFRTKYPNQLIAIDATSSMGGVYLDFKQADIWYASVQKCFGLPAGMAVMVCSPKAIAKAQTIGENGHYNSLVSMVERIKDYQTTYTPNVLSIFLLMKILDEMPHIKEIDRKLTEREKSWYDFFIGIPEMELLVKNTAVRSTTVIPLMGNEQLIQNIKKEAKAEGLLLGNGYGNWKSTTFRIANFPAIKEVEIDKLKDFITRFR